MANIFEKWMDAGVANCDQIAARPQKNDMVGYDWQPIRTNALFVGTTV